jgi:hypothetical protein
MNEIEAYLSELMGDFCKKVSPINNSTKYNFCYYKNLYSYPTIQMVIQSPFIYDKNIDRYLLKEENYFLFFLYDLETDMIIGEIEQIYFDESWQEELSFSVYDSENKVLKYICPSCDFWLVERSNKYGHRFLGCCGFPECDFSCEIDSLED